MAHGRWYPTVVTLSDGKVFVVNGMDEYGKPNLLVEIYDPATKTWSKKLRSRSLLELILSVKSKLVSVLELVRHPMEARITVWLLALETILECI